MKARFVIALNVLAAACAETPVWTPFDEMPSPHNNIEHIVEVNKNGSLTVDGRAMHIAEARQFFRAAARREIMAYVYVQAGKGASAEAITDAQGMIEESGMCKKNSCVDGYMDDPLP